MSWPIRGRCSSTRSGDIPLELQPKLLRVLQEQEFERLGGTRTIRVSVRLVAATNRDLAKMVADGEFRSDLYLSLERLPDRHCRRCASGRMTSRDWSAISPKNLPARCRGGSKRSRPRSWTPWSRYTWPGNVRELQNVIERAVILCRGSALHVPLTDSAAFGRAEFRHPAAAAVTLTDAEREHILEALRKRGGCSAVRKAPPHAWE